MCRKICVVTGTRADYGHLKPVLSSICKNNLLELQLLVTGMHLSHEFGLTYRLIEDDGFSINKKIEMLLSADTPSAISKSIGLAMCGLADVWEDLNPDIIVVLGDRYEIFAATASALMAKIPVAHLHGGEATEGAVDEALRHAITKMSHLHFTAHDEYRRKVIQLGENPKRVFNFGAPGLEDLESLPLINKSDLEKDLNFNFGENNFLVTFHPTTLEHSTAERQFIELLSAFGELENTKIIFTKPNADTDGRIIIKLIDDYVESNPDKSKAFVSMGRLRYLSAMQYVDGVIGNSSSGIIEAPSFNVGTVNIGDRQKGRIRTTSIVDCSPKKAEILEAIKKICSKEFQRTIFTTKNPYVQKNSARNIVKVLAEMRLENLIKKSFYSQGV